MDFPLLKKLESGLFIRSQLEELNEPANMAAGIHSERIRHLQRQWQYSKELLRIANELSLTIELCKIQKIEDLKLKLSLQDEDLILYYQGVFLDLIHQFKDKLFKLIFLITAADVPKKFDVSYGDLIKQREEKLKEMKAFDLLRYWSTDSDKLSNSALRVGLEKRTNHHHYISPLHYDLLKQDVQFARTMLSHESQAFLSDSGKIYFSKLLEDSLKQLLEGALQKMENTCIELNKNIEEMSSLITAFFNLPIDIKDHADTIKKHFEFKESLVPKNLTSYDKLAVNDSNFIKGLIANIEAEKYVSQFLSAIYLVGSVPRGEYNEDYSDRNIYIIVKDEGGISLEVRQLFDSISKMSNVIINLMTVTEFNSPKVQRDRFFCRFDGLLVYGVDSLEGEQFPPTGIRLAWLLNNDFDSKLEEVRSLAKNWVKPSDLQITVEIRKLAKMCLDLVFGLITTNKAIYTSSRIGRYESILNEYPHQQDLYEKLWGVMSNPLPEISNLENLIGLADYMKDEIFQKLKSTIEELGQMKKGDIQ